MNALRTADPKNCHSPVVPLITILYVRECQTQNGNKNKKQTSAHLNKQLFPPYTSDERKNNRESAEGTKTRLERRALEKRCTITTRLWERKPDKEITIETAEHHDRK